MRRLRTHVGSRMAAWFFKPVGTHEFLNVRTYVQARREAGIYFMSEWVPNRLVLKLGPALYGLPYRLGQMRYRHVDESGELEGHVCDGQTQRCFAYEALVERADPLLPSTAGSLEEFLLERYSAFTHRAGRTRFFRIWHQPWRQRRVAVQIRDASLLTANWPWLADARLIGAHFSPGVHDVWIGWPHALEALGHSQADRSMLSAFWEMP
jgi:hypothetical protein